jgi:rfaE bifunctional protein kinase chain/domain
MKYLVLGDIMLDRYLMGDMNRISPEAPVPIVDVKLQYDVLGGAANCARNIVSLGMHERVDLIGCIGNDADGDIVHNLLKLNDITFCGWGSDQKPTIVKERIFASNQQLLRVDIEDKSPMEFREDFFSAIDFDSYEYIIVSDYAKGVVNEGMMKLLAPYASKMIIDPKPANWYLYPPAFLIKPNEQEYEAVRESPMRPQHLLITKGKDGMTLIHYDRAEDAHGSYHIPQIDVDDCNVIGAGDTVTAAIAVTLATTDLDLLEACKVANDCARYVVSQSGTAVVPQEAYERILYKEVEEL